VLIHCFQWTQSEVGELLGLSKATIPNHLERGMGGLRREIGDVT
jgi:DNA-directed RNA polymerase specialized sigma24 family protein